MAETKQENEKKPLKLNRPGRLELKKTVESGTVKQSFSHGRSKQVAVEVKKKRTYTRGKAGSMTEVVDTPDGELSADAARAEISGLSEAERAARIRALEEAARSTKPSADEAAGLEAPALEADSSMGGISTRGAGASARP